MFWTSTSIFSQSKAYYWTSMSIISQSKSYYWTSVSSGCLNLYFWVLEFILWVSELILWVYRGPAGRSRGGAAAPPAGGRRRRWRRRGGGAPILIGVVLCFLSVMDDWMKGSFGTSGRPGKLDWIRIKFRYQYI